MIVYPVKVLEALGLPVTMVLGYQADLVKQEIVDAQVPDVAYVVQEEQLGTGHAVLCSKATWDKDHLLILNGDIPLLTKELVEALMQAHEAKDAAITFLAAMVIDPSGYGRVIEENGTWRIVEEKDCTPEQRQINRMNAGVYLMKRDFVEKNLEKITKSSKTGELYLVDLINMASEQGLMVQALSVPYDSVRGVNTLQELWSVEQIKRSEFIKYWMANGVRFELAQSIHIDINVEIGAGSFIGTGVHLLGNTKIGEECFVGAFSILMDSTVGDNTTVHSHSVLQKSKLGSDVEVGPFARLRDNADVGNNVKIGNFVEIKNTQIGDNARMKHLTYLGDAQVGQGVNIGAGTITCNHDGVKKSMTIIEDGAFVGSNNTLIAPVTIGKGAYTAGGSTITDDVPEDSLAIGRSKQVNKVGYAKKLRDRLNNKTEPDDAGFKNTTDIDREDIEFNFRGAIKTETDHKEGF